MNSFENYSSIGIEDSGEILYFEISEGVLVVSDKVFSVKYAEGCEVSPASTISCDLVCELSQVLYMREHESMLIELFDLIYIALSSALETELNVEGLEDLIKHMKENFRRKAHGYDIGFEEVEASDTRDYFSCGAVSSTKVPSDTPDFFSTLAESSDTFEGSSFEF